MLEVGEESVKVGKRTRVSGDSSATLNLAAVSVFFRADRQWVDIRQVRCDYNAYRGVYKNP